MSVKNNVVLFLIAAILLAGCTSKPPQTTTQKLEITQREERTIRTTGYGEVKVKPDVVRFVILIETADANLSIAQKENDEILQKILVALKEHEILNADIKEDDIKFRTAGVDTQVNRYILHKSIEVTLRDLSKMESVFTKILEAGAFQISDIRFQISNIELYKQQALILAVADATGKAELMAGEFGKKINDPISIIETGLNDRNEYPYSDSFLQISLDSEFAYEDLKNNALIEETVTATVNVQFELK